MGIVYRAEDLKLGRQVAIKVLPSGQASEEAVQRFRREARTASSLNHPNICTIYGFDEEGGQCYLVMELLDGEPLDQRLNGRPLDLRLLLDIAIQVADALDAAHAEGVLHRDIKSANIFITRRGQVKVLDFGLAKLTADRRQSHSEIIETRAQHFTSVVGTTVGTIAYMSPEQARGEDLDPRTDLFSFGVVLYEMATGRQSFPGHTTAVVFDGILNREPVPPSTVNQDLPADLDRIIAKALEKDRSLRYQTAADLKADLQRLRRDSSSRSGPSTIGAMGPISMTTVPGGTPATVTGPPSTASGPTPPPAPNATTAAGAGAAAVPATHQATHDSKRWVTIGAAVLGVSVIAGALFVFRGSSAGPAGVGEPTAPSAPPETTAPGLLVDAAPPSPPTSTPAAAASPGPPVTPPVVASAGAGGTPAGTVKRPPPKTAVPAATPVDVPPVNRDREATERLEVARAKLASHLVDQGVADLRQIVLDYPGSPVAVDATFLAGDTLEKAGRPDDAMAMYIEFDRRFAGHARVAESKLRRARLLQSARSQPRQSEGYLLFGDVAREFPGTPEARAALQARRQIETERRQLRALDPVLNVEVPALLVTLRMIADQFPGEAATMVALNQLASGYEDLDRHQAAAEVLEHMAAQFPGNPMEVWFRLGELYERRLRNLEKAREAYGKVPPESPRYREAQQRLRRR